MVRLALCFTEIFLFVVWVDQQTSPLRGFLPFKGSLKHGIELVLTYEPTDRRTE